MKKIGEMYRKLYAGDEKQKFYSSKPSSTGFRSGQIILVAKDKDRIAGYCWVVWYQHIKEKGISYLEEIYLEESVRGHAIGKAMINKAIHLLKDLKIRAMYLAVGKHMEDAQKFYRHIGFKESEEQWFEKEL